MPQLNKYLRDRGLKTTGTKEDLTALAYGADQCSAPTKVTAAKEELDKVEQYKNLLHCRGQQLADLFDIEERCWEGEEHGMTK